MSFFTFQLLILIFPDCQAQVKWLHMALDWINTKGQVQKGNKIPEMGPKHEYVFGLGAWAGEMRKKVLSRVWMNVGVSYHTGESTDCLAALTESGALQVPRCHICHNNRLRVASPCLLTNACTTVWSVAIVQSHHLIISCPVCLCISKHLKKRFNTLLQLKYLLYILHFICKCQYLCGCVCMLAFTIVDSRQWYLQAVFWDDVSICL